MGEKFEKTEVRIVAGTLRGRKIACFVNPALRPTPQMVREAFFSILGNAIPNRPFFDLFAGTGVVGLEAVSRGASRSWLVEQDAKQANAMQRNAERFGVADRVTVVKADVYRWAERWLAPAEPVNVFLSPPFPDLTDKAEAFLALVKLVWDKCPPESVVVVQAELGFPAEGLPDPALWEQRTYGRNVLLIRVKEGVEIDRSYAVGSKRPCATGVPGVERGR
ncbi:MAG TPA: RsmD family RNA methyltransferase [Fimbriiglobus sp.]